MDFGTIFGNGIRAAFGPEAAVYALAAVGLNMHYGYTGLLNFGQVGFMLVGGYGLAIAVATWGWSMWAGIAVGLLASVLLSFILGAPTLRLRADYFAIVTIAVAEILRRTIRSGPAEDLTGGPYGLQSISERFYELNPYPNGRYGLGTLSFTDERLWVMTVTWILVALATGLVLLLTRSPWGRVLKSIREEEDAARSLGKNIFSYKMQSLVIGGLLGSLAGIMFAISSTAVSTEKFQSEVTFYIFTILILGGAATRVGPVVGSIIFWFLFAGASSFMRQASDENLLPGFLGDADDVGAVTQILVGVALILLMVFRPQGMFGDKREMVLDE